MGLRIQMSRLMVFSGEDRGILTSFGGSCHTHPKKGQTDNTPVSIVEVRRKSVPGTVQAHRSPGDVVGQSVGELEH